MGFTNTVRVKKVQVTNKKRKSFFTLSRARLMASFQCELEKVREYISRSRSSYRNTETDEMSVINIS